jgi:hypothetical protein
LNGSLVAVTYFAGHTFTCFYRFVAGVLAAYKYKMTEEQQQWWRELIRLTAERNDSLCDLCGILRMQIAKLNLDIAAAKKSKNEELMTTERGKKY